MHFKPYPGTRKKIDLLTGIAPVFRFDPGGGRVELIGTGFWVTEAGHLVTAWHVVDENIGSDGVDRGPIFAIQIFSDRSVVVRNFRKTDRHPNFDLALSETVVAPPHVECSTSPISMSLDELGIDEPVFSFAVIAYEQVFDDERLPGATTDFFSSEISVGPSTESVPIKFAVRLSLGKVTDIFEKMRDRIMLPFPCIQTDVAICGGNSGGPLFDVRGRICAINCTSFGSDQIAFHIPVQGVLHLRARTQSLGIDDQARRQRTILELAALGEVLFEPPMLYVDRPLYSAFHWLWYAVRCLVRREMPSANIHLAISLAKPPSSFEF